MQDRNSAIGKMSSFCQHGRSAYEISAQPPVLFRFQSHRRNRSDLAVTSRGLLGLYQGVPAMTASQVDQGFWRDLFRFTSLVYCLTCPGENAGDHGHPEGRADPGHDLPPQSLILRLSGATSTRVSLVNDPTLTLTGAAITGTNAAWVIGATEQQFEFGRWNGHTWTW
jgi:hypothetical protein